MPSAASIAVVQATWGQQCLDAMVPEECIANMRGYQNARNRDQTSTHPRSSITRTSNSVGLRQTAGIGCLLKWVAGLCLAHGERASGGALPGPKVAAITYAGTSVGPAGGTPIGSCAGPGPGSPAGISTGTSGGGTSCGVRGLGGSFGPSLSAIACCI